MFFSSLHLNFSVSCARAALAICSLNDSTSDYWSLCSHYRNHASCSLFALTPPLIQPHTTLKTLGSPSAPWFTQLLSKSRVYLRALVRCPQATSVLATVSAAQPSPSTGESAPLEYTALLAAPPPRPWLRVPGQDTAPIVPSSQSWCSEATFFVCCVF
ncbi:hypothetical protein BX667DRAFT_387284 [Coemansia mojavensis]|nr:hypothetical protein BX667DRAFT_387284 [Coemansia mojavensis]